MFGCVMGILGALIGLAYVCYGCKIKKSEAEDYKIAAELRESAECMDITGSDHNPLYPNSDTL